jgi:hypothetical protein
MLHKILYRNIYPKRFSVVSSTLRTLAHDIRVERLGDFTVRDRHFVSKEYPSQTLDYWQLEVNVFLKDRVDWPDYFTEDDMDYQDWAEEIILERE